MAANPAPAPVPPPDAAWDLFHKLLPARLLNDLDPRAPQTAYTPFVVTWLLVYQRLHGNATLNDAVGELLFRFPQQARPDCKRAREKTLSANSGAYAQARIDLDVRVLYWASDNLYGAHSRFVGHRGTNRWCRKSQGVKVLQSASLGERAKHEHGFGALLVPEDASSLEA
jgi:hypothetical protein